MSDPYCCPHCGLFPCCCTVAPLQWTYPTTTTAVTWAQLSSQISDADVERIAKRVVELLAQRDAERFAKHEVVVVGDAFSEPPRRRARKLKESK